MEDIVSAPITRPVPGTGRTAQTGRVRAVWRERHSSRHPVAVFRTLAAGATPPAFLYSGDGIGDRYSLIAIDPAARLCVDQHCQADPFSLLREALAGWTWRGGPRRPPTPFVGGWVGYFSYDLLHWIERVASSVAVDHGFPLVELCFYRTVLTYDHGRRVWTASRLIDEDEPGAPAERYLEEILDSVLSAPPAPPDHAPVLAGSLRSNFTRGEYEAAIMRALEYIAAGDIYQVNISQRFEGRLNIEPERLASRLFGASPAPFSAFLPLGGRAIVSASPERFLLLRGGAVETWPIKGTRPRGSTPAEDARLKAELLASEKERAELTMITDLLRNDIGRVCAYGSVLVAEPRVLESYSNVHHTFSKVVGRLRPGVDVPDLLRATFPGGSVTGAPKVRAMEIIEELEPTARGPYCGAIGYIGVDNSMDLNMVIRTVLCEGDRLTFQVGGGIVADSVPAREYEETLHKAQGIMKALNVVSMQGVG